MNQTEKLDFITKRSGLDQQQVHEISKRCKLIKVPAGQDFKVAREDLKNYSFFITNKEGALLFPISSEEGLEWRLICSAHMFFPYSSKLIDRELTFKVGYACRESYIVGIKNQDVKWLRANSEQFRKYMEKGLRLFLDHVISGQSFCHRIRSKRRVHAAILLALERYGYDLHTGERVVHFRQSDIAALSGTTIQSVCNVINDLKKINVLRTQRKSIIMSGSYFKKYRSQID